MKTFQELQQQVIEWANARNIIQGSTELKQASKTMEEVEELVVALSKEELLIRVDGPQYLFQEINDEVIDAMGDILVTLINLAEMRGVTLEECLASAYDEIKDRKGKMIGGKFVKEADL